MRVPCTTDRLLQTSGSTEIRFEMIFRQSKMSKSQMQNSLKIFKAKAVALEALA
jgi:hypothetical protein